VAAERPAADEDIAARLRREPLLSD